MSGIVAMNAFSFGLRGEKDAVSAA